MRERRRRRNSNMSKQTKPTKPGPPKGPSVFNLLTPYRRLITWLILFALLGNVVNLLLPKIVARGIDDFNHGHYDVQKILVTFSIAAVVVFIFAYLQSVVQTYASERVAKDMRNKLSDKISRQSYAYIEQTGPSKLLTNLTGDVDAIKMFVSQAIVSIASSIIIIVGVVILLFTINWRLALAIIGIIPIIGGSFAYVLKKVRPIFMKSRGIIDKLNKVINESILGSALIRVINSQMLEYNKFFEANTEAKNLGLSVLRMFAALIPTIIFTANMAGLTILALGGRFVITGSMSLGDYSAFSSYLAMLIFPILIIGFMSNVIAQATASYVRINMVLDTPDKPETGMVTDTLHGDIELNNVSVVYGQKPALKNISFSVSAGTKLAVIGPTAAGKTQLLYLLTGLIKTTEGTVEFDGRDINTYVKESFHSQVGFVFQDSIMFNMSIRENIAFSDKVTDESLAKAIATAELKDFIDGLPDKLDTLVSERGTSLSGGQKQRIMLARALAVNPKVLLLDDFTARVDTNTETKILKNVERNYPGLTLISVTQKIASVEHFHQVIVLMEGEIVATGTHDELMATSPEYVQIYDSQQSTSNYELQPQ